MTLSFNVLSKTAGLISLAIVLLASPSGLKAQSTLQDHPTPITRNELNGTIHARDLGDARLTTYYYWFEGSQGDVFINLNTRNFAGDIDVFTQNGLKSLNKIIVFPDFGDVETGRVIYLRKPERLILRVQGRTPNDESASFRFKFAGSFVAATGSDDDVPEIPKVSNSTTGRVQVNSAGTIIPPPPKPTPAEAKIDKETEAMRAAQKTESQPNEAEVKKATTETTEEKKVSTEIPDETKAEEKKVTTEIPDEKKADEKLEVVVTDPLPKAEAPKPTSTAKRTTPKNRTTRRSTPKKIETPVDQPATSSIEKIAGEPVETPVETKADPLANVQLVILFKDGRKIERPLTEVFKFSVDGGVLTVIAKDGRTGKYQMVDVAKVTIQ